MGPGSSNPPSSAPASTLVHAEKRSQPSPETILDQLSTIPLMRALPPEEMHALVPHVRAIEVPSGTTVVAAGTVDPSLYLIVDGALDVMPANGSPQPLRTMENGDAFGETALLTGQPRDTTVRARRSSELLTVSKEDFDSVAANCPALADALKTLADNHARLGADEGAVDFVRDPEHERAWKSVAIRAWSARKTGLRSWHYILMVGGLMWLALWANEQIGWFPEEDYLPLVTVLQLITGLLLIDAASEALILATDRTGARLNWDGFTSGTIGSLVETAPEFFVIAFLVLVDPYAAFLTSVITLFNNAIAFSAYSFFLPKDQKGGFVMPMSLAKAGSEVLIAGSGLALIMGIVMMGSRMEGTKTALVGPDLIVVSAVFIGIYCWYQYAAVKYYAEDYGGDEEGHAPDPKLVGHSTSLKSIIVPGLLGLIAAYFGGEAIGAFADTAINGLHLPVVPTAAGLAFFAGFSEFVVVAQAHRRGEIGIALSNTFGGLTQVQTLLLPFAMLVIGIYGLVTGNFGLYQVPINIQTIMLMILQFPMLYVLISYIQEDHTMNNLDAFAMTGSYIVLMYFLFSF